MKKLILLLILVSCSSRPKLYPNAKYMEVGEKEAEDDINICMEDADKFLKSSKGKQMVKGAGAGAAIGAAMGAVAGVFTGSVGRSAVRGGAIGAAGGGVAGGLSPDQVKRNYVNQCLAEKEYQVLGWD